MKICWDNIEKLKYYQETGKFRKGFNEFLYKNSCKICNESYLTPVSHNSDFCSHSCSLKNRKIIWNKKISESKKGKCGDKKNPNWKGGYSKKGIPRYDLYYKKLDLCEKTRRNKEDKNILEVKCTYCGKWYVPKLIDIKSRLKVINGKINGEYRLYCSNECKKECSIYRQVKYPKGYKKASSREVQPELRQLVFERDNWTCQKCNSKKSLHCHHIEGIRWIPLESADIDKCITYCKKCHIEVHKIEQCGYKDMECK